MIIKVKNLSNDDCFLIDLLKENYFSKDLIKKLKKNYDVYKKVLVNEEIDVVLPDELTSVLASKGNLNIIYEDDYIIIINKENRLSTIPSIRHYQDNLASHIKYYYDQNNIKSGIHFINRLDKDTRGLLIVAKHQYIQSLFVKKNIEIIKKYYTLVKTFDYDEIIVEEPIARYQDTNIRCINPNGDYAKTLFTKLKETKNFCIVEATLFTGRTHQIRVHLKHLNCPIIGDVIYNEDKSGDFYLCSYYLRFNHPIFNKTLEFKLDLDI